MASPKLFSRSKVGGNFRLLRSPLGQDATQRPDRCPDEGSKGSGSRKAGKRSRDEKEDLSSD